MDMASKLFTFTFTFYMLVQVVVTTQLCCHIFQLTNAQDRQLHHAYTSRHA